MEKEIFISYSRLDTTVADRICDALDKAGISYFIDRQGIGGGMEFPVVLAQAILDCKLFLYLASENSYKSRFTTSEITFAFNEKEHNSILPYIIDGSTLPAHLRFIFSGINWRTITNHPVETILVDDLLHLLGRERKSAPAQIAQPIRQGISEAESKRRWTEINRLEKEQKFDDARWLIQKLADDGDAKALCEIAKYYEEGKHGYPQDIFRAIELYSKSSDAGYWSAQDRLAEYYDEGKHVPRDLVRAFYLFKASADQGWHYAQYETGRRYIYGIGCDKNPKEGVRYLRLAVDRPSYQANNPAQYELGRCYEEGIGVARDMDKALELYNLAVRGSDGGYYYDYKNKAREAVRRITGVTTLADKKADAEKFYKDDKYAEAFRLYLEIEKEDPYCWFIRNRLGHMYYDGIGTQVDYAKSAEMWQKGVDFPTNIYFANSAFNLGLLYEYGDGVPMDKKKAFDLYVAAGKKPYALCAVGRCYCSGTGVGKDLIKGKEYLDLAEKAGSTRATELKKKFGL